MAVRFDASIVSQIQQANDIVDLVSEHVSLAKKGREMVALCPFHEDHRPSMYVSPIKQIFKCFACGAGGDVFKFVQMRENLTFPQAVARLAERVGIKLEERKTQTRSGEESTDIDPNTLAKVNEWAAKVFEANLQDETKGVQARAYVAERKIAPDMVKKWRLGLAAGDDDLLKQAKAKKASLHLLSAAGLLAGGGAQLTDKFLNRLMFAITDVSGRVIAFGGRTLDETGAKYINSPTTPLFDKSNCLYGLEHARRDIVSSGVAVVVEGYTDCMMAHQLGCYSVVATLGTSFTAGHARMLRRYANRIVLIYDSDVAGIEAANRAMEVCLSQRVDIKIASVPQGKDPCDFLLAAGKEAFEKVIAEAADVFEFKWNRLSQHLSADQTLAERKKSVEDFLGNIAAAAHAGNITAIERGLLVNRLSKIVGIESGQMNKELSQAIQKVQRSATYAAKNQSVRKTELGAGLLAGAQREILEVLLNAPELFGRIPETIRPAGFEGPVLTQAAEVIFAAAQSTGDMSLTSILAATESVEVGNAIVEMAEAGEKKGNFKRRLEDTLRNIARIEAQREAAEVKLSRTSGKTDRQNLRTLGMV